MRCLHSHRLHLTNEIIHLIQCELKTQHQRAFTNVSHLNFQRRKSMKTRKRKRKRNGIQNHTPFCFASTIPKNIYIKSQINSHETKCNISVQDKNRLTASVVERAARVQIKTPKFIMVPRCTESNPNSVKRACRQQCGSLLGGLLCYVLLETRAGRGGESHDWLSPLSVKK